MEQYIKEEQYRELYLAIESLGEIYSLSALKIKPETMRVFCEIGIFLLMTLFDGVSYFLIHILGGSTLAYDLAITVYSVIYNGYILYLLYRIFSKREKSTAFVLLGWVSANAVLHLPLAMLSWGFATVILPQDGFIMAFSPFYELIFHKSYPDILFQPHIITAGLCIAALVHIKKGKTIKIIPKKVFSLLLAAWCVLGVSTAAANVLMQAKNGVYPDSPITQALAEKHFKEEGYERLLVNHIGKSRSETDALFGEAYTAEKGVSAIYTKKEPAFPIHFPFGTRKNTRKCFIRRALTKRKIATWFPEK